MPQQIFVVHGGNVFANYEDYFEFLKNYKIDIDRIRGKGWKESLQESLGSDFDVIFPRMPNSNYAKYAEWKLWFEKFFSYLENGIILIGGSLGGIFLAKYLSEDDFPVRIRAVILIAPPFDDKDRSAGYTLGDFKLPESLKKFEEQSQEIILYHSKDDPVVPFDDAEKYAKALPKAQKVFYEDKGHFTASSFPELIEKIKEIR